MTTRFRVTRNVADGEEHNWAGRSVFRGEHFTEFEGCSYGSCDEVNGVVLTGPDDTFFEFPRDAVEEI
jgi:hypothetical protein